MENFVRIFKALGEPTRLKILKVLSVRPMYVCELEAVLAMSQPRISQHLRVLKEASLLLESKEAQKTFYRINHELMEKALEEFNKFLTKDIKRLPEFSKESMRIEELEYDCNVMACKEDRVHPM